MDSEVELRFVSVCCKGGRGRRGGLLRCLVLRCGVQQGETCQEALGLVAERVKTGVLLFDGGC